MPETRIRLHHSAVLATQGIALGLLLCLTACKGNPPAGATTPAAGPAPAGRGGAVTAAPVAVVTETVQERDFSDRFRAVGTTFARESVELTTRISSTVSGIHFQESEEVKAGELLVTLEASEIQADLALAEAALAQSRSQYQRSQQLADTRVISESQLEELEAKMKMNEAQLQAARARLENSRIRAPFAGMVGLRRVSPGDLVNPGTVITTLDDMSSMRLEFSVPENFLAALTDGLAIRAEATAYPGRSFEGRLISVDSRLDPVTRTVTAVARLPNPERLLKPGMFLTVTLERPRRAVLMVPEGALNPRQGRQFVFVIEEGRAIEHEVEVGAREPGLVEIRSGLSAGDSIVVEGTQRLRDGLPVRPLTGG